MKKIYWLIILVMVSCWCINLGFGTPVSAQPKTYTVQKGDTLWDICEKVYGDPELWPQLWEMNPFITNPHLLEPGDTITLLPNVPTKKTATAEPPRPAQAEKPISWAGNGVDVSGLTNVNALGYLATQKVVPWGAIFATDTERIILSAGDMVFVQMDPARKAKAGDLFTIYRSSVQLKHPFNGERIGYALSFLGRAAIRKEVKENLYEAEITESYRAVRLGDAIMPYEPVSPCVQLASAHPQVTTNIVAIKEQLEIIGQFSVVYLPLGYNEGVLRGNLFEILKKRQVESPLYTSPYEFRDKVALPDMVVGHLVVLESRPDTSTGVVIATKENVPNGVSVRGMEWTQVPDFVTMLSRCPLD
ncbi:MAG: LysM domain-containing protein [Deltaproteobacteria bacterium]